MPTVTASPRVRNFVSPNPRGHLHFTVSDLSLGTPFSLLPVSLCVLCQHSSHRSDRYRSNLRRRCTIFPSARSRILLERDTHGVTVQSNFRRCGRFGRRVSTNLVVDFRARIESKWRVRWLRCTLRFLPFTRSLHLRLHLLRRPLVLRN